MKKINLRNLSIIREKTKRYRASISRMRRSGYTTESVDIKKIRGYYEPLCARKVNNLNEMDKLLERHKLPKGTQEQIT